MSYGSMENDRRIGYRNVKKIELPAAMNDTKEI